MLLSSSLPFSLSLSNTHMHALSLSLSLSFGILVKNGPRLKKYRRSDNKDKKVTLGLFDNFFRSWNIREEKKITFGKRFFEAEMEKLGDGSISKNETNVPFDFRLFRNEMKKCFGFGKRQIFFFTPRFFFSFTQKIFWRNRPIVFLESLGAKQSSIQHKLISLF